MIKVNEYFEGKVKSLTFHNRDGENTVGVMSAGDYRFNTGKKELVTVIDGSVEVLLKGETLWKKYVKGETFIIQANNSFELKTATEFAYLCEFR